MKKRFFLLPMLLILLISGCTNHTHPFVKPYKLTKQEEQILNLTPIQQGNIYIYEATLPNKQDEIRTTIEYYKDGTKVKEIGGLSSSHFEKEKIKLAFGQQTFQYENGTREVQQWFMNISGDSYKFFEEIFPERNASTFTSIREGKTIKYNEKIILGAWIFNTNKIEGSATSLEDDRSIQRLIKENEHVYTYCIEVKNSDVTK
ncbi:hypothetical protein [Bacillus sp. GB_SG_008]|uniref:hypothetical protein n=1 Tax=Bacillus sp. GB_SG_008 TaxID=3454627 RepID=UPI003F862C2B